MFCTNCGEKVGGNDEFCKNCGAKIEKEESIEKTGAQYAGNQNQIYNNGRYLIRKRSFVKYFFLSIITFGIYGIYVWYGYVEDLNKICEGDGKKSPNYIIVWLLTMITFGIYGIYWWYRQAERLRMAGAKYGVEIREKGSEILLWRLLGAIPAGLGGFLSDFIMLDNMNWIALRYNGEKTVDEIRAMGKPHPRAKRYVAIAMGVVVALWIALLIFIFSLIKQFDDSINSSYNDTEETIVETDSTKSFDDVEELLGISVEIAKEYGFNPLDEDSEDILSNDDMSLLLSCQDGVVTSIDIEENSIYPFHDIYVGDTIEEAKDKLGNDFQVADEGESYLLAVNSEMAMSVWMGNSSAEDSSLIDNIEIQTGVDVDSILKEYASAEEDEAFIGNMGTYSYTDSSGSVMGNITISQVGNTCDFTLSIPGMSYDIVTGNGPILDNKTLQIPLTGFSIICTWTDSDHMTVTRTGDPYGMDAGLIIDLTENVDYVYSEGKSGGFEDKSADAEYVFVSADTLHDNYKSYLNQKIYTYGTVQSTGESSAFDIYGTDAASPIPVMGEFDEYPEIGDEVTVYGTVTESPSSGWLIIEADYFKFGM